MRGEETPLLVRPVKKKQKQTKTKKKTAAPELKEADQELFARLRDHRAQLAAEKDVPAYVIFPDRTLKALATHRPQKLAALSDIYGIGEVKKSRYGESFLDIITSEP